MLQAGDCAESFEDFSANNIREKLRVILQMAVVLMYSMGVPVVKVGRIAGQFAKPRSSLTELIGDDEIPVFRGHSVNDPAPTAAARIPAADRLVQSYHQSASTLNLLRAFTKGGFASLDRVHAWTQEFVSSSPEGRRYEQVASDIERALQFMRACGMDVESNAGLREVDVYTSHEALLLGYETRPHPAGLDDGRLVRLLRPHALDRRAHPRARRRARRVPAWCRQPDRVQGRPHHHRHRRACSCATPSTRRASPGG